MEKLFQKRLFNGHRKFEIVKQHYLVVTYKSLYGRINNYRLDLLALDPRGRHLVQLAWPWLIAAGIMGVLAVTSSLLHSWPKDLAWQYGLHTLTSIGAVGAATLIFIFIYRSSFERIYYTRHSDVPLVSLFSNRPDRKQFRQFTKNLETIITDLSERNALSVKDQFAGEMKMLRRLVQEKVITEEAYTEAKNKLFQLSDEHSLRKNKSV